MWVRSKVRGREVAVFLLEDSRVRFTFILVFSRRPFARCKGIQDILEFWIPRHGFRIPGTGIRILCQWNLDSGFQSLVGFQIPRAVFRIPKPRTPDSTANFSMIPKFHKKKFRRLRGIQIPLHWATFLENNRNILVIKCEKYKQGKS